jgi:hypothetical protein
MVINKEIHLPPQFSIGTWEIPPRHYVNVKQAISYKGKEPNKKQKQKR